MNNLFLKILFIIVILILIYKSYYYKCENFSSDIECEDNEDGDCVDDIYKDTEVEKKLDELIDLSKSKFILDGTNIKAISENIDTTKSEYISGGEGVGTYLDMNEGKEALYLDGSTTKFIIPDLRSNTIKLKLVFKTGSSDKQILLRFRLFSESSNYYLELEGNKIKFVTNSDIIVNQFKLNEYNYVDLDLNQIKTSLTVNGYKQEVVTNIPQMIKHIVFGEDRYGDNRFKGFIGAIEISNLSVLDIALNETRYLLLNNDKNVKAIFENLNKYAILPNSNEQKMIFFNGFNSNLFIPINIKYFTIQFYFKLVLVKDCTIVRSKSGNWYVKLIDDKLLCFINGIKIFIDKEIKQNVYYNLTIAVNSAELKVQLNNIVTKRSITNVKQTKDILFGMDHSKNYHVKGFMGLIEINSKYLTYDEICKSGACIDREILDFTEEQLKSYIDKYNEYDDEIETTLATDSTVTQSEIDKAKQLLIQNTRLTSRDLAKDFMSDEEEIEYEVPEKINVIVKSTDKEIILSWLPPENYNRKLKYVILMRTQKHGVINKFTETKIVSEDFLNDKDRSLLPIKDRRVIDYSIEGNGKHPDIFMSTINGINIDITISDGYDFDKNNKIVIKYPSNKNEFSYLEFSVTNTRFQDTWSNPYLIFPKNENCKFCNYTFKNLNNKYKYQFAVLAIGENNKDKFDPKISDLHFIETKLLDIGSGNVDSNSDMVENVICQKDGTFMIHKGSDNLNLQCNSHLDHNIGLDHNKLINYLKPNDPLDLGVAFI
jgi:hypothetical protein